MTSRKPLPFTFTAQWDSTCMTCMGEIRKGDEAGYINGSHACHPCIKQAVFNCKE